MATDQLKSLKGVTNGSTPHAAGAVGAKIKNVEYFRVKPRWLFVKITDDQGNFGWGRPLSKGIPKPWRDH